MHSYNLHNDTAKYRRKGENFCVFTAECIAQIDSLDCIYHIVTKMKCYAVIF